MTRDKLLSALKLGEGHSVEFKRAVARPEVIGRVVCGFVNSGGGLVVVGVDDGGKPIGVSDADALCTRIESSLVSKLSPRTPIWISSESVGDARLVLIEVPAGKDVPYAYENVIFLRSGEHTRKANVEEIRDLVLRRSVEPERWERRLAACSTESDVDAREIAEARHAIALRSPTLLRPDDDDDEVLNRLEMAKYGRLTHGGVVAFGRSPGATFPQARARAVAFAADRTSDSFRDQKSIDAPLVRVIEELFAFVVRNTPTVSRFSTRGLQREDSGVYPTQAIREGLVNAVVHRDYTKHSGGVAVHVYPERIEIWNSGTLPEELTPDSLLERGHVSILRNPDIAHVVYLRGLMEKVGRGSVLIAEECRSRGLPPPRWVSDPVRGVTLTLRAPEVIPQVTPEVIPQVDPQVTSSLEPEERLVCALTGEMRARELQEAVGVRDREDFRLRYLSPALARGWVEMTMPEKPRSSQQRYRLSAAGKRLQSKKRTS